MQSFQLPSITSTSFNKHKNGKHHESDGKTYKVKDRYINDISDKDEISDLYYHPKDSHDNDHHHMNYQNQKEDKEEGNEMNQNFNNSLSTPPESQIWRAQLYIVALLRDPLARFLSEYLYIKEYCHLKVFSNRYNSMTYGKICNGDVEGFLRIENNPAFTRQLDLFVDNRSGMSMKRKLSKVRYFRLHTCIYLFIYPFLHPSSVYLFITVL